MMDAMTQSILVPIDIAAVLTGLAAGDPRPAKHAAPLSGTIFSPRRCGLRSKPRFMPSCRSGGGACAFVSRPSHRHGLSDASERLTAPVGRPDWAFVPYVRPGVIAGADNGQASAPRDQCRGSKACLVIAGDTAAEAAALRVEVSRRLARAPRPTRTSARIPARIRGRRLPCGRRRGIACHCHRPRQP